jgi:hypothetical protein
VSDANKDGKITVDEALLATHSQHYKDGVNGYATGDPYGSGSIMVTKLWGKETIANLFFLNGQPLDEGVTTAIVNDRDLLTAALMKDSDTWSDWFATFGGQTNVQCIAGGSCTFKMTGYPGMTQEVEYKPVEGVTMGAWTEGTPFKPIVDEEGNEIKTDENGEVTLGFPEEGTYIITAQGTVKGKSWTGEDIDCPIIAPVAIIEVVKDNQIKVTAKTVNAKADKKTTVKASKVFTVKKAKGDVTYKQKTKNSKITVAKNGNVTVKKGLKKGKTYKIKVRVTDEGNEEYAGSSADVTLKVKVK